ncbi:MAG: HAD family hydrolase [Spirochaetaceae bacterium]|nr:HAD family hydrolase [Spirochaetaceae bacterium]
MTQEERRGLVKLLVKVSPSGLAAEPPLLRPDLAALVGAPLPRRPRAVLFDVYGTLLMSAAGGEPNLAGDADGQGGEPALGLLEEELSRAGFRGGARRFALDLARAIAADREARLPATPHPEVDIQALVSRLLGDAPPEAGRRAALLLEAWLNPCAPMPGARELPARLRASGLRLGLVSNAQFYTPLLIEALLDRSPEELGFEAVLAAYSFEGGIAKPAEELFMRAAGPLLAEGLSPGGILVVGNSSANDIAPARRLGFMTALFAGDARSFRPTAPGSPGARPDTVLRGMDDFEEAFPQSAGA